MLAYAFQILREKSYAHLAKEDFDNVENLLGAILSKGVSNQVKRGLNRDYIENDNVLTSPHGKINVSETVNRQLLINKKVSCVFDEFTSNTILNQIIKTTMCKLIHSENVSLEVKNQIKKTLIFFSQVSTIDLKQISWAQLKYNRNNATYKMLINICYLILNNFLQSDQIGDNKLIEFEDEQRMHKLYEKFILEYYRKHYPLLKATASQISWDTDDGIIDFLPVMKSDISLSYGDKSLIIDAKYYGHSMQTGMFDKKTVHSNNLYQIYTYVKNKDIASTGNVGGMLLYAKTDEEITPDFSYELHHNKIQVKTLDLNNDFEQISKQLDEIVSNWIPGLAEMKCS